MNFLLFVAWNDLKYSDSQIVTSQMLEQHRLWAYNLEVWDKCMQFI